MISLIVVKKKQNSLTSSTTFSDCESLVFEPIEWRSGGDSTKSTLCTLIDLLNGLGKLFNDSPQISSSHNHVIYYDCLTEDLVNEMVGKSFTSIDDVDVKRILQKL